MTASIKYHLIHHRLASRQGHRFNEAMGFQRELSNRNVPLHLYMHETADAPVRDAFPSGLAVLTDSVFDKRLDFDQRTDAFVQMLHRHLDERVMRDDRVLVTVATQCEARAFMKWLACLPVEKKPWVTVFIFADRWNWVGPEESSRQLSEWSVLREELATLAPSDHARLIFAAATPSLAEEVIRLVGGQAVVAPTPFDGDILENSENSPARSPFRTRRVGLLGGARLEKGSRLVPSITRLARARAHVEFIVQLSNEGVPSSDFQLLANLAGASGITTFSDPQEYMRMLNDADVLLMPYETTPYRRRTSGIFFEGVIGGKPVVVPQGTWMGEQVQSGRAAGIVFNEFTPESVTDALVACLQDCSSLERRARTLADGWRTSEGVSAFIDRVELEISTRRSLCDERPEAV